MTLSVANWEGGVYSQAPNKMSHHQWSQSKDKLELEYGLLFPYSIILHTVDVLSKS